MEMDLQNPSATSSCSFGWAGVITQAQTDLSCLFPSGPYLALQPHTIEPDILTRARAPLGQDLHIVSLMILATAHYLLC